MGTAQGKTALSASGTQTISAGGGQTTTATTAPDPVASGTSYTFAGTGWGHSVGMSQYGAKAMAEQGCTYKDILTFYFTGVTIL